MHYDIQHTITQAQMCHHKEKSQFHEQWNWDLGKLPLAVGERDYWFSIRLHGIGLEEHPERFYKHAILRKAFPEGIQLDVPVESLGDVEGYSFDSGFR